MEIVNLKPPLVPDLFSEFVLEGCLSQLDVQPQMVYKVCELLTTCAVRNGVQWRDHMLTTLINEVMDCTALIYLFNFLQERKQLKGFKKV